MPCFGGSPRLLNPAPFAMQIHCAGDFSQRKGGGDPWPCGGGGQNLKVEPLKCWGLCRIDDPAPCLLVHLCCSPLARASKALMMAGAGGPTRYIDAWMNAAGYEQDRLFELYVVLFLVDFMSEHGQTFNRNPLPAAAADRGRLLAVFADRLQHLE
jgi:hypothetical protein